MMNKLVAAEGILVKASVDTNIAETSSSKPKSKGKGGWKKKNFTKQEGKQVALGVTNKERRNQRTTPKENVSIMVRKITRRGTVQNS